MRARQFPGQEQQVFQFYQTNPQALAEIRAPIFEDKVVDFIAELAQVTEKQVDRETLFMDPDEAAEKLGDKPADEKPEKKAKKAKKTEE
jgi:trigger factor